MAKKLSRRQIAVHVSERLLKGDESIIDKLAALLISENRIKETKLITRDIESCLAELGELVITVETARKMDDQTKQQVQSMFNGKTVHMREVVCSELLGGCRISTPSQVLDATIAKKLNDLKAMKV